VDARLAKNTPGRNARFAGKQRIGLKDRVEGKSADNTHLLTQLMPTLSGSDAGIKQRRNAAKNIAGSDASAQEVMPGRTSGEVMLALARQEAERKKSQRTTASGNFEEHNNSPFLT